MCRQAMDGTVVNRKDSAYGAAQYGQQRGCGGIHRGETVCIAGEPGVSVYTVLAVDPVRSMAVIARPGSTAQTWRMPLCALRRLD